MKQILLGIFLYSALPLGAQIESALPIPHEPPKAHCDSYSMASLPTLDLEQKACFWRNQMMTGTAVSGAALWGFVGELRHKPPEWSQGAQGFGEQFGTRYAQGMVKSTATFLTGALLREDPRIETPKELACSIHSTTIPARVGASILRVVYTPSRDCHRGRPAFSRVAGSFASGFVSLAWAPPSQNHVSTALAGSGTAFAGYIGNSVFTEFQGDLFRILGKIFTTGKPK
jgi:hypothetical protein